MKNTSTRVYRRLRLPAALAALAAALVLTGCGVVANFVPPIEVGDPLGVDGQRVDATLAPGSYAALTSHVDTTRSFDLPDLEQDLYGFSVDAFEADAGLEPTVELRGGSTETDYPERFTVERARVEATLADDANGSVSFERDVALGLTFVRGACASTGCSYSYDGDVDELAGALTLAVTDGAELDRLVAILKLGDRETPNTGSLRVAVDFESDADLAGLTASFTLTSEGSTIELGG